MIDKPTIQIAISAYLTSQLPEFAKAAVWYTPLAEGGYQFVIRKVVETESGASLVRQAVGKITAAGQVTEVSTSK